MLLIFFACGQENESKNPGETRISLFKNQDGSWGYDIAYKGKPYVHQPHRPATGGLKGFSTEQEARKVAELVAHKIRSGILPPSVSKAEVDSLIRIPE